MFGIGGFELFIILIFGFLIFGPEKLPEIAKTVGKGIARFREAQQEMNDTLGGEKIFDPNNPDEPFKDPVEVLDKLAQKQEEKKAAKAEAGTPAKTGIDAAAASLAGTDAPSPSKQVGTAGAMAGGAADSSQVEAPARQESFTERKARYERERAARKAAEKQAAEGAAGATAAQSGATKSSDAAAEDAAGAAAAQSGAAKSADAAAEDAASTTSTATVGKAPAAGGAADAVTPTPSPAAQGEGAADASTPTENLAAQGDAATSTESPAAQGDAAASSAPGEGGDA